MILKLFLIPVALLGLKTNKPDADLAKTKKAVTEAFSAHAGTYAMAFKDLQTGREILINGDEIFHAASTMKTPVLVEAYRQDAEGIIRLNDSVTVTNSFKSIVDGSSYSLSADDDSETELYGLIGKKLPFSDLLYRMIIRSSNLATNNVIDILGAKNVNKTMHRLGAKNMSVLRGVEDGKAYSKGLNNTLSAKDLMVLFSKIASGKIVNKKACDDMIRILLDQKFNDVIPGKLPANVKVAHKTGSISGVHHDSGIVFLPNGRKYVLVLLSKNISSDEDGVEALSAASKIVYDYMINN